MKRLDHPPRGEHDEGFANGRAAGRVFVPESLFGGEEIARLHLPA